MIRNATRGTVLATDEVWATSAADRMRGLLERDGLEEGEALVISPCTSVHMFGMSIFQIGSKPSDCFPPVELVVLHVLMKPLDWFYAPVLLVELSPSNKP